MFLPYRLESGAITRDDAVDNDYYTASAESSVAQSVDGNRNSGAVAEAQLIGPKITRSAELNMRPNSLDAYNLDLLRRNSLLYTGPLEKFKGYYKDNTIRGLWTGFVADQPNSRGLYTTSFSKLRLDFSLLGDKKRDQIFEQVYDSELAVRKSLILNVGGSVQSSFIYSGHLLKQKLLQSIARETVSVGLLGLRYGMAKGKSVFVDARLSYNTGFQNTTTATPISENGSKTLSAIGEVQNGLIRLLSIYSRAMFVGKARQAGIDQYAIVNGGEAGKWYNPTSNGGFSFFFLEKSNRSRKSAYAVQAPASLRQGSEKLTPIIGATTAFIAPAAIAVLALRKDPDLSMRNSKGYLNSLGTSIRALYYGLIGVDIKAGIRSNIYFKGINDATEQSLVYGVYAGAGVALPFGQQVPLFSYFYTDTKSSSAAGTGSEEGVVDAATSSSQGGYTGVTTGSNYPTTFAPAQASSILATASGINSAGLSLLTGQAEALQLYNVKTFSSTATNFKVVDSVVLAGGKPVTIVYKPGSNTKPSLKPGSYSDVQLLGVNQPTTTTVLKGSVQGTLLRVTELEGSLAVGDLINGAGIKPGTMITGIDNIEATGLGTYTLSISQSVGSSENEVLMRGSKVPFALANVTVASDGTISSFAITQANTYMFLPQTSPKSGLYSLFLDTFTAGMVAQPQAPSFQAQLHELPLVVIDASQAEAPLSLESIVRIQEVPQVAVDAFNQGNPGVFPKLDPTTGVASDAESNNNATYSYRDLGVHLFSKAAGTVDWQEQSIVFPELPTANVLLSQGQIQSVVLDRPLFLKLAANASYQIRLDLPSGITSALTPSFSVTPSAYAYNNFVDEDSLNPQAKAEGALVYLSAGVSSELPILQSASRSVAQNRVTYVYEDQNGNKNTIFLNPTSGKKYLTEDDLTLASLYETPQQFSAAMTPTVSTVPVSPSSVGKLFNGVGGLFVAWVEADPNFPVVPISADDGYQSYQNFMESLYGHQRINYRVGTSVSDFKVPAVSDLYKPDNAVIRHLQAFTLASPFYAGRQQTLLVWAEVSIDAIKNPLQQLQAEAPPAAVIKAAWINPDASSSSWLELTKGKDGASSIQTIPWDQDSDVGLTIDTISANSQLRLQADGSFASVPLVSWNQEVRTPYRASVLQNEPTLYLQFNALQAGINDINIGTVRDASTTATFASSTGLNFNIAGALANSQATAVQNIEGIGELSTDLGTINRLIGDMLNNAPPDGSAFTIPRFSATIAADVLSVSAFSEGDSLSLADVVLGPGVLAGTTISEVIRAFDPATPTLAGLYRLNQAQSLPLATVLEAIPTSSSLPTPLFSASISADALSTLIVTAVISGSLRIGDLVVGPGFEAGTYIREFGSGSGGNGTYILNQAQQQAVASSALLAVAAGSSAPYSLEFWSRLPEGSNSEGAGLVAIGQPSAQAIGTASLPQGWLLTANFVVEALTVQSAAEQGLIEAIPDGIDPGSLYGWGWGLLAEGANTTALNGNGGDNLYANALSINNLISGVQLKGVDTFLANYQLSSDDLPGFNGEGASTVVQVPFTDLQFDRSLDATTNRPLSRLNGIGIESSSALLNQGVVLAASASSNQRAMFETLVQFQQQTGKAKINFDLAPPATNQPAAPASQPAGDQAESYAGYQLGFSLLNGPAVSVDGQGRLVFDVADGLALTSQAVGDLPNDLRDGRWHYVVASYVPDYVTYRSADGTSFQLPEAKGTASLYVDNKLVSSASTLYAYGTNNLNDQAQFLVNNAGGAIDHFALYDKALTTAAVVPPSNEWPTLTSEQVLELLKSQGIVIDGKTPDRGELSGAVTKHWLARNVNPLNAAFSTYTSAYDLASGSWTDSKTLNPSLAVVPTTPSASTAGSLQDDLVVALSPQSWNSKSWTKGSSTSAEVFNPAGRSLQSVSITLTPSSGSGSGSGSPLAPITLQPQQILLGDSSLQDLQPTASSSDLNYIFLTNQPELTLILPEETVRSIDKQSAYTANVTLNFETITGVVSYSNNTLSVNRQLSALANAAPTDNFSSQQLESFSARNKALATAAVLEQTPVQLKYIDSGAVLSSTGNTFGYSQVFGSFVDARKTTNGWLAISQPISNNALSDPAGRIYIQFTGQSAGGKPSSNPAMAPVTWLNALANANFLPDQVTLPLLNDATHPNSSGGLLIQADPTVGWGDNAGANLLVADVNGDGNQDLVIAAPNASGGGRVYIVNGGWIRLNLTSNNGATILNLANPTELGPYVTVLTPDRGDDRRDLVSDAQFGTALAFDGSTLWIGGPNYQRQLDPTNTDTPLQTLVSLGAIYGYRSKDASNWGTGVATPLAPTALGSFGYAESLDATNTIVKTAWGARLGTAIATTATGELAVSAPGLNASTLAAGTEKLINSIVNGGGPLPDINDNEILAGANFKIQLPSGNGATVSSVPGRANPDLVEINTKDWDKQQLKTFLAAIKKQITDQVADATLYYNQSIQIGEVGAVYYFKDSSALQGGSTITAQSAGISRTYYGVMPWNTLGNSGFGSSLAFGDFLNTNDQQALAIGASRSGGPGVVYLMDSTTTFADRALGSNQSLAALDAVTSLYGTNTADQFGSGLLNLGDVNADGYEDLMIQAYSASAGGGEAYVLFGSDVFSSSSNPAVGSVNPSSSGQFTRSDGTSFTRPILSLIGNGSTAATGQGNFSAGDVDGDGLNDILNGAGGVASAYLAWGKPYLPAINSLQLSRLASDNGYLLNGLATTTQGSLRSVGDFNNDGFTDFISILPGQALNTVRLELGGNTQSILADYLYNDYEFTVSKDTQVLPVGDVNGDGCADLGLFLLQNSSSSADNAGAGSTTGILYGRESSQLPIGAGFGLLAPVGADNSPSLALPGLSINGGLSDASPTVITAGATVYVVVKGVGNTGSIWFNQSRDGGNSWDRWTDLSSSNAAIASRQSASLAFYRERLYLAFLDGSNTLQLSSWDPTSNDPSLWTAPTPISDGQSVFSSRVSPQLIDNGDSLALLWLDSGSGTLRSSLSTMPEAAGATWLQPQTPQERTDLPDFTAWSQVSSASSSVSPALASDGTTTYMVCKDDNSNYPSWTSSRTNGQSWNAWQNIKLPDYAQSGAPLSIATFNGEVYVACILISGKLCVSHLIDPTTNTWASAIVPNRFPAAAIGVAAVAESVNGTPGLGIYFASSNDSNAAIVRIWSGTPQIATSWSQPQSIGHTTSGPLALTSFQGQSYLAHQIGTPSAPSSTAKIITAANPSSTAWTVIGSRNPGNHNGVGLSHNGSGLLLNTADTVSGRQLIDQFSPPAAGSSTWFQSSYTSTASVSSAAATASILSLPDAAGAQQLLLAAMDPNNLNRVETSTSTQEPFSFAPIASTVPVSAAWLGGLPLIAVNQVVTVNGLPVHEIKVYSATDASYSTWQLASTFSPSADAAPINDVAPVLASTGTGVVLSYGTSDGAVVLQRLNVIADDGMAISGQLSWQQTRLDDQAIGNLDNRYASVPFSIGGTLQLANIHKGEQASQLWLNAVPVEANSKSITWLNTTVQLPDGNGGWLLQQSAASYEADWQPLSGGASPFAPSFATASDGTVYAAVRGYSADGANKFLYWNRSADGGQNWSSWQKLPDGMTSDKPPTIATYGESLYLVYIGTDGSLNLTSLASAATNTWSDQVFVRSGVTNASNQSAQYATLVGEGTQLSLYYLGTDNNLYLTHSTTNDPTDQGTFSNSAPIKYNGNSTQTSSGPLAAVRYQNQTYLAYQGGKPGSPSGLYLTTGSDKEPGKWRIISAGSMPQPLTAPPNSVGLTANQQGLVLSYSEVINGQNVLALQQGKGAGDNWTFSPFATLQTPAGGQATSNGTSASLYATSAAERVLVSSINTDAGAGDAINQTWVSYPNPSLLDTVATGSTLSAVGDISGDGYADLVLTTPAAVLKSGTAASLVTGLRLIRGAATSAELQAINDPTASVQTVQAAPFFGLNSALAVASLSGPAKLTLTATSAVSGQPSTLHTDLDVSRFLATAADPGSLQQLFNPDTAPLAGQAGLGLGFGSLGLNSTGSFGDLNGDGYLDYLNSSPTSLYGGDGLAWLIWSLRSAGDVNGNGTDDVLLGLVPPETVLNQQPQWIQSVLLDGLLFDVDTSTHSFGLDQLKVAISPNGLAQLAARSDTSTDDQISPTLQYWFDPILGFKPPTGNQAVQLSKSSAAAVDVAGFSLARTMATAYSSNGQTYLVSSGRDTTPIQITSFGADGNQVNWSLDLPGATISKASSKAMVSPSGAVIYGEHLYILASTAPAISSDWGYGSSIPADYNGAMWLLSISLKDLNSESAALADKWTVTTLPAVTKLAPALVDEGNRLSIYFVANNNDMTLQRIYSRQPLAPEPVWVGGSGAPVQWTDNGQLADIKLSKGEKGEPPNAFNLAATRFQGRTVLGFTQAQIKSASIDYAYLLEQQGSAPDSPWLQSTPLTEYDQGRNLNPYGIYLGANASQLGLALAISIFDTVTTNQRTGETILTLKGYESNLRLYSGVTAAPTLPVKTTSTEDGIVLGLSAIGSHLTLQTQAKSSSQFKLQTYNSVWAAAQQSSLAGYSLDGASDINGDGFGDLLISDPSDPALSVNNQYAVFGGDFLGLASQVGTPAGDVLVGTPLADVFYTLQGDDEVFSRGGADVITTGAGNDKISIRDNAFIRIDGGEGVDLLQLQGLADQSYDFRLGIASPQYFMGTKLRNIEQISSIDYGANQLSFDAAAVNASNANRLLLVTPDSSDSLMLSHEFVRNAGFDANVEGSLWSAYAAGPQDTPANSRPALLLVRPPAGESTDAWLSQHVQIAGPNASASQQRAAVTPPLAPAVAVPSAVISRQTFGENLTLEAYRSTASESLVRFRISRSDASNRQVVLYATSSESSLTSPGKDYNPVMGCLVFAPGETSKTITIPLLSKAITDLPSPTVSLKVEAVPDLGQQEQHLIIKALSKGLALSDPPPVLSGFTLMPTSSGSSARLSFRADSGERDNLQLRVGQRASADSPILTRSRDFSIRDFSPDGNAISASKPFDNLPFDRDRRTNHQVSVQLQLNFEAGDTGPIVSVLGEELAPVAKVELVGSNQIRFLQEAPLTTWRADSSSGLVTFGLHSNTGNNITLITGASGGTSGSLNPTNAKDDNITGGWQSTEALAIGSRAITAVQNLSGQNWTPTASQNGAALALLNLAVDGNQVTATFTGGVTSVFWQASGTAPALLPAPAAVEVQRLTSYDNTLGFYSVDSITGNVNDLNPGDTGYLQAALARSREEGLLLDARTLPAFGASATFNSLPLNTRERYGMLLLQNGDETMIFSSFAAANPGGYTQMVSLSNSPNCPVLGIEDGALAGGRSDGDFNDLIISLNNVSLALF